MIDYERVRETYRIEELYERGTGVTPKGNGKWLFAPCIFHNDTGRPNLGLIPNESKFHCFGCLASGDVCDLAKKLGLTLDLTKYEIKGDSNFTLNTRPKSRPNKIPTPVPDEIIQRQSSDLINDEELSGNLGYITEKRGLSFETIKANLLGWTWTGGGRVTIPIRFNSISTFFDISTYNSKFIPKFLPLIKGQAGPLPFIPVGNINKGDKVWMVEGEWDALLLQQELGTKAKVVTNTHGCTSMAKVWSSEYYRPLIENCGELIMCGDVDKPGQAALSKTINSLFGKSNISVVEWDKKFSAKYPKGDITDFIVSEGRRLEDLCVRAVS